MISGDFHRIPGSYVRGPTAVVPNLGSPEAPPDQIVQVNIRSYITKNVFKIMPWFI